jgi:glutathione synthase/RimK-type ligase-like ATP-grasp enzyme
MFTIAINPDQGRSPEDTSAPRWKEHIERAGHAVRLVDVKRPNILEQLEGCDAFVWRFRHNANDRQIARRMLPVLQFHREILLFPDFATAWHYDDKISQAYLFEATGIPSPKSWVFFDREVALDWAKAAEYPVVFKLWGGASSANVKLVHSAEQAASVITQLFGRGTYGLDFVEQPVWRLNRHRVAAALKFLFTGTAPPLSELPSTQWERHRNYVLFQRFLPENGYDTRITVIGKRAFGFRRLNRENDFRASGSGRIDYAPERIDPRFVHLAFDTAERLSLQSVAIDGLYDHARDPVTAEMTYTFASDAVHACPGHWVRETNGSLTWSDGHLWPEAAQAEDLLNALQRFTR